MGDFQNVCFKRDVILKQHFLRPLFCISCEEKRCVPVIYSQDDGAFIGPAVFDGVGPAEENGNGGIAKLQGVILIGYINDGALLFSISDHIPEGVGILFLYRCQEKIHLCGVQDGSEPAYMVNKRVCGDDIVDLCAFQCVSDIAVDEAGSGFGTAVNNHGFAVTQYNGAVALTHIKEVGLQVCLRDCRQDQDQQEKG